MMMMMIMIKITLKLMQEKKTSNILKHFEIIANYILANILLLFFISQIICWILLNGIINSALTLFSIHDRNLLYRVSSKCMSKKNW
jgi:hypothetical protein